MAEQEVKEAQLRSSEIRVKVALDEGNVPVDLKWQATDSSHQELKDCKAVMMSIWDPLEKNTLSIDLWTDNMMVDEMHAHFLQTLMNLTTSYKQATGNPFVEEKMRDFCKDLAEKTWSWEEKKAGANGKG